MSFMKSNYMIALLKGGPEHIIGVCIAFYWFRLVYSIDGFSTVAFSIYN